MKAPRPENEVKRLEELYRYDILDTPVEEDFNDVVNLASRICGTPLSDISLIDAERQWFKARFPVGPSEMSREEGFCTYTILQNDLIEVTDATKDERFQGNPHVKNAPHIRFYAGVPLTTPAGYNLGALCVVDNNPGRLSDAQREVLRFLGKQVMKLLELHRQNRELKHYIRSEQLLRQELERVTEIQKTMISVIAHDVRSPLHSLKTVLNLFDDETLDAKEVQSLIPMAGKEMNGTLELLDNIVDWGMLQVREGETGATRFLLYPVVEAIQPLFENRFRGKGNVFVNAVPQTLYAGGDPHLLQFILRNLVDNAGKFTSGGTVTVGAETFGDHLFLSVRDTGVGMNEDVAARLFTPGFRHTSKGTGEEKGSGLGLKLCLQFVDRLGGRIHVESEVGKGTTVRLDVPL